MKKWMVLTCSLLTLVGASLPLSDCISRDQESIPEGVAFGAGVLREPGTMEKVDTRDLNVPPPVYNPPQVIFRIDGNRYLTLENYTRYENRQTFCNNKAKNIHVKILGASGYLFKGRLFWSSTRDDSLALPTALNTRYASCMGSNRDCMNAVIVTADGGKRRSGTLYGSYTQNPTGAMRGYDMLVINGGFYLSRYRGGQGRFSPAMLRWILNTEDSSSAVRSEDAYELFRPREEVPSIGLYKIDPLRFYPKNNVMEM